MRAPNEDAVAFMATLPEVGNYDIRAFGATADQAERLVRGEYLRVKRQGYASQPWREAKDYYGFRVEPVVLGSVELV